MIDNFYYSRFIEFQTEKQILDKAVAVLFCITTYMFIYYTPQCMQHFITFDMILIYVFVFYLHVLFSQKNINFIACPRLSVFCVVFIKFSD